MIFVGLVLFHCLKRYKDAIKRQFLSPLIFNFLSQHRQQQYLSNLERKRIFSGVFVCSSSHQPIRDRTVEFFLRPLSENKQVCCSIFTPLIRGPLLVFLLDVSLVLCHFSCVNSADPSFPPSYVFEAPFSSLAFFSLALLFLPFFYGQISLRS